MNQFVAQLPQELLAVYQALVKNAPSEEAAAAHLVNFLKDANTVISAVQSVLDAAQSRIGS